MTEMEQLRQEVEEIRRDLARADQHDPDDPNVKLARACFSWCLDWRLERLGEIDDRTNPQPDRSSGAQSR